MRAPSTPATTYREPLNVPGACSTEAIYLPAKDEVQPSSLLTRQARTLATGQLPPGSADFLKQWWWGGIFTPEIMWGHYPKRMCI